MIISDERGQGAAEYILLFGGVIVIAIATLIIYTEYIKTTNPLNVTTDLNNVRESVKSR